MRWDIALALRLLTHAIAASIGSVVAFVGLAGILISLFGTGAFTTAPPPDRPGYLGAVAVGAIWIALEAGIFLVWRKVVRTIDAAEAK